jgi:divalent metal cation (Fe/Co/Zn/Cd) transporter
VLAAYRVSVVSVGWTVCTSAIAVAIGVASSTVVFIALGAVGLVDAIGSVTLGIHFRDALRNATLSERRERAAHLVVLGCLAAVGASAVVIGVIRLVHGDRGGDSNAGVVLAAVSAVSLLVLSRRKVVVAASVGSAALRSDGHLSAIGAMQAVVALLGTVATRGLGWTWADSVATAVVGAVAVTLAIAGWLGVE